MRQSHYLKNKPKYTFHPFIDLHSWATAKEDVAKFLQYKGNVSPQSMEGR